MEVAIAAEDDMQPENNDASRGSEFYERACVSNYAREKANYYNHLTVVWRQATASSIHLYASQHLRGSTGSAAAVSGFHHSSFLVVRGSPEIYRN